MQDIRPRKCWRFYFCINDSFLPCEIDIFGIECECFGVRSFYAPITFMLCDHDWFQFWLAIVGSPYLIYNKAYLPLKSRFLIYTSMVGKGWNGIKLAKNTNSGDRCVKDGTNYRWASIMAVNFLKKKILRKKMTAMTVDFLKNSTSRHADDSHGHHFLRIFTYVKEKGK